jgi:hypothetical protein
VRLLTPLAADLGVWRAACGDVADDDPVFPDEHDGVWTANGFEKWRQRRFKFLLGAAGLSQGRPYDLRHSFASLLLHEGRDVIYVARQLGHGADLTLRTYGHVIEELADSPQLSAEEAIAHARSAHVNPYGAPGGPAANRATPGSPFPPSAPSRIRTCGLLLRRESLYPAELSGHARPMIGSGRPAAT